MIYLSGDLEAGTTNFLDENTNEVTKRVVPEAGMVKEFSWNFLDYYFKGIMFDHRFLHEGEELKGGTKYIMRMDVMYRKVE